MLGQARGVYKFEDTETVSGTTTKVFKGPQVKAGLVVQLQTLTVADYTTANKKLLIGREDSSGEKVYSVVEKGSSRYESHLRGQMVLLEGERPIGVVESPTASDVLYFTAYGWVHKLP